MEERVGVSSAPNALTILVMYMSSYESQEVEDSSLISHEATLQMFIQCNFIISPTSSVSVLVFQRIKDMYTALICV